MLAYITGSVNEDLLRRIEYGTPLHVAAANDHEDVVELLRQHGGEE